jgi:[protein-PII] uridylyltransferase
MAPLLQFRAAAPEYAGPRGPAYSRELSRLTDGAFEALLAGTREGPQVAVVALGGYGRSELGPASDIDVMILRPRRLREAPVRALLYPLWDAGLTVGHSVRTVDEALAAAEQRLENVTALMDARFVAGERELFEEFAKRFERWLPGRRVPILRELLAREHERRSAEPYPLQEPNLKDGRGGLRAAQGIRWAGRAGAGPAEDIAGPYGDVLAARNALHVAAGKPEAVLRAGSWRAAGRWLGAGEDWPRAALAALRRIDLAAGRFWRAAADGPDRRVSLPGVGPAPAAESPGLPSLLAAGDWTAALDSLGADGRLDIVVPGLQDAWCLPQQPEFHRHPLDVHLRRTVDELLAITSEEGPEPCAARVAGRLPSLEPAMLAAFLHDLGKVDGDRHEERGADRARNYLASVGYDERRAAMITTVVREHLLLPRVATTRDLDDEDVIRGVVARVGDLETLHTLYLASVADGRASGPNAWNEWKAELVRGLHARAERWLTEHEAGPAAAAPPESGMPASYFRAFGAEDQRRHEALMSPPPGEFDVRVDAPRHAGDEAVVVARDRPGLLSLVAGACTASGISILSAQVFTRDDGVALEVLRTASALGGEAGAERFERARSLIAGALKDVSTLRTVVDQKIRDYRPLHALGWTEPRAVVRNDASARYTVIEINAPDRVGLLYTITRALAAEGLDIHLARVTTQGEGAYDTFYVSEAGGKVVDERRLAGIEARVREALGELLA